MSSVGPAAEADRQLPVGEEIFLDHVGHFVRDPQAASRALVRAGFAPTPVSVQVHPDPAGVPQPTGTGNVTAMLGRGYIEALFRTADTPLGREFDAALSDYCGIHLAAFSVADAASALDRLATAGFPVRPLVDFQRPVTTEMGEGIAAFTVARVERGAMAEGRIQILTHRTEGTVWQKRWLAHPNGAHGLLDLVVVAADPDEAAARFSRFTGRTAERSTMGRTIRLDRGRVELVTPNAWHMLLPAVAIPRLPFMAAYALKVASLDRARAALAHGGVAAGRQGAAIIAAFPPELGVGAWWLAESADLLPWRS
jgi:hypothetical protein